MTKDETLKLALEALELHGKQYPHMVKGYCLDAITAIKEALAQPEQEQFALKHRIAELEGAVIGLQAQRTWVGLTEDEAFACQGRDYFETYKAIEAKLRSKND